MERNISKLFYPSFFPDVKNACNMVSLAKHLQLN